MAVFMKYAYDKAKKDEGEQSGSTGGSWASQERALGESLRDVLFFEVVEDVSGVQKGAVMVIWVEMRQKGQGGKERVTTSAGPINMIAHKMQDDDYQLDEDSSEEDYEVEQAPRPKLRPTKRLTSYNPSRAQVRVQTEKRMTRHKTGSLPVSSLSQQVVAHERELMGYGAGGSEGQEEQAGKEEEDDFSIFNIEIAQFLWRRKDQDGQDLYLVKFKGRSYLHVEWVNEEDAQGMGKNMKNKLNRFNKTHNARLTEQNYDEQAVEEGKFFDQSYLEVDRIISATEMFPVIHQKKANQLKGKWSESLMVVCSKLLNFTKNHIHFGVLFSQPVDPVRDNCPQYPKIVTDPMDLGTILNKIYLDLYRSSQEFWNDIGLVFKNCLLFNREETSDLHLLGLTLRQCAIFLYDQWHHLSMQRFDQLRKEMDHLYQQQPEPQAPIEGHQGHQIQQQNAIRAVQQGRYPLEQKSQEVKEQLQAQEKMNAELIQEQDQQFQAKQEEQIKQQAMDEEKIQEKPQNMDPSDSVRNQQKNTGRKSSQQEDGLNPEQNAQAGSSSSRSHSHLPQHEHNESHSSEKDYLDMQQFYKHNVFLTLKRVENITNKAQVQILHPGVFNYDWIDVQGHRFLEHNYDHIDLADMRKLDLNVQVDRLYMIKWKNLSYSEATWQLESVVGVPQKIHQFRNNNKALGKQARNLMDSQKDKHRLLVDIQVNPKKKSKFTNAHLHDIRNKLYFYDVGFKKQPYQYKVDQPHIYKNYKILRPYQTESVNWLIKSWYEKRNTILADQMGLGKTIQSIAFLYHLYTFENVKGPFLVIAPLSTLQHWKRAVEQWTNLNCILYYDQAGQPGRRSIQYYQWYHLNITMRGTTVPSQLNKFQIIITSYEVFLLDFQDVILNVPFQFIIVDEAHRLKNKNAKILSSLKRTPCKRVLLLTGTPIQNNTGELWSLLNYINPQKFTSFDEFKRAFGDLSSKEQVQKLNKVLKPYMLRRMKEDVQQSIPPLQQTIIDVEMTNLQKTIYKALYEKNKDMLVRGLASSGSCNTNLNNLQIQLRKCCNHPFLIHQLENELLRGAHDLSQKMQKLLSASGKMVLVQKLLQKCKAEGKKVLIFSQFTHMLQLLEDFLKWKQYKIERIDGQIKAKERQAAIDRYNNPTKKRDVFLLSTKAGGVGINLTSANVVIIYDSDWNPQNDVQATARAHRIGQKSQVQVYRLITCNTYQTEMFQRATQKLGLDKAIFIGGEFKQAGQILTQNKLSKNQMQTLLKKGILGFLEGAQHQNNDFFEKNVDEIIQNNSRIAKYSLINGSCSFSKSRFISQNSDNQLKINDPNFWNKILKNVQSPVQNLLKKMKEKSFTSVQEQRAIMLQASEQLNILIQNKLTKHGLNSDDQINLIQLLTQVNSERVIHKFYRDMARNWLQEIEKPSRRFKRVTVQDLVIQSKVVAKKIVNLRSNEDNIFADQDEDEEQEQQQQKTRLDDAKKQQLLKRLCAFCEKPKCVYYCNSFCKRSYHQECLKKVVDEGYSHYDQLSVKFQPIQLTQDIQLLKMKMNTSWSCVDCDANQVTCAICKLKGAYFGAEYKKSKKNKKKDGDKKDIEQGKEMISLQIVQEEPTKGKRKNQLTKCSTANCAKYFHPKCIQTYQGRHLFKYIDTNSLHFRCSLHYCAVCGVSGDTMSIFQCVRCPKALHNRCMDKEKVVKTSKKHCICDSHFKNKKQVKKVAQRFAMPANTLKKYLKAEKIEAKKKLISESEQEKQKEKQKEKQPQIAHNYSTRRNRITPQELQMAHLPPPEQPRRIPQRPREKIPTLSYEDFNLTPIKDFDYKNYDKDWCRYCGSRYSSNFTQGPWGSKTLCTVHYISWKQNRTLNLSDYPQRPETPIDPTNDQQLKFLTSNAQKFNDLTYPEVIELLESKRGRRPA